MPDQWQCGRFEFSLGRPILMGVVNVTPDSFSDGGQHATADEAIAHARLLVGEGAQILDIGGESTRPGSESVDVDLELARVLPIVEAMRDAGIALSVDTCKPQVMRAVLDAGADMINDITGFTDEQSRDVVARHATCGVCVMHMQGKPRTMQVAPHYDDVVVDVRTELLRRAAALQACGVARGRITVDPGSQVLRREGPSCACTTLHKHAMRWRSGVRRTKGSRRIEFHVARDGSLKENVDG